MNSANITFGDSELYEAFSYPAGERQVRLTQQGMDMLKNADEIRVLARVHGTQNLIDLILLGDALDGFIKGNAEVTLILPYLPYSRADRRFTPGDCFGLGVFLNLIHNTYDRVVTMDLHSDAFSNVVTNVSPLPLIKKSIIRFCDLVEQSHLTVLFPDAGAAKRYTLESELSNNVTRVDVKVSWCRKKRDPVTGKLSGFDVPPITTKAALIVDDICDGGGTFLGIAEAVAKHQMGLTQYEKGNGLELGLYVTHGIFSQGFERLHKVFRRIYTADTFLDFNDYSHDDVCCLESIPTILKEIVHASGTTSNAG